MARASAGRNPTRAVKHAEPRVDQHQRRYNVSSVEQNEEGRSATSSQNVQLFRRVRDIHRSPRTYHLSTHGYTPDQTVLISEELPHAIKPPDRRQNLHSIFVRHEHSQLAHLTRDFREAHRVEKAATGLRDHTGWPQGHGCSVGRASHRPAAFQVDPQADPHTTPIVERTHALPRVRRAVQHELASVFRLYAEHPGARNLVLWFRRR